MSSAPLPNADLSDEIQSDYAEAAAIAMRSPRGAAALLRLAIQKLCRDLGGRGDNLNADIGALVAKGLPAPIQQALDAVRVIGNEAVHPGELDLRDDVDTVGRLFRLINAIADQMITRPKEIAELYDMIPPEKREQIEKRNAAALEGPRKAIAGPAAPASGKPGA